VPKYSQTIHEKSTETGLIATAFRGMRKVKNVAETLVCLLKSMGRVEGKKRLVPMLIDV
jgi:hypothetical protein